MNMWRAMVKQQTVWLALFFLLCLVVSCVPSAGVAVNRPLTSEGEIFLFLQPMGEKAAPLKFTLEEATIRQEGGPAIPFTLSFSDFVGADRIHSQSILARARVPAGLYQELTFTVAGAEIMTEDGPVALQIDPEPVRLPVEMDILPKKAVAYFLTFHADKSLVAHVLFRPVFSGAGSPQLPLARLGYVSLPSSNNLFVFHDNSMLYTGVIATGIMPRGLVIDRNRDRLYAALGDDTIAVADLFRQEVIGTVRLRPGDDPREIALSSDGTSLVSANYGSNTVSVVDPVARVELSRVGVGAGPTAVVIAPGGNAAYSMDSLANTISVVDTKKRVLSSTIHLEESPYKAALSRTGSELYVITENSPNLLLIDLAAGTAVQKVFVGTGARSILVDTLSNLVYVGRRDGEIAVIDPTIRSYIDSIQVGGLVEDMVISDEGNFLFALLPRQNTVKKVNLTSKEVMAGIELAGEGYGIALVGAR